MTKFHNPMVVQSFTLQRGVSFVLNSCMGTQDDPGIDNINTDLLVLTQMSGSKLSEGMRKIDERLSGELARALGESQFQGESGQSVLIDGAKFGLNPKHILVVGLGNVSQFNGRVVCALMRRILEVAKDIKAEKVTLPIFPNRQTEEQINLEGTVATLVCRVKMFVDELPNLKEVELFCTPQARRHLQDGLFGRTPRCMICLNPELGKH